MSMSMLGSAWRSLRSLLFPVGCMVCGEHVDSAMRGVCIRCRYEIPLTGFCRDDENPVKEHFAGLVPVEHASSFIYYSGGSLWQELVHRFKYGGEWSLAERMGEWYGAELRDTGLYGDVDAVLPVPLHPLKMLRRGYNQSRYLGEGIARSLGVPLCASAIRRTRNNPPQARRRGGDRWDNVDNLFSVRRPEMLRGRHILVVDDVLTSGATLTSCIMAIRAAVPDCRISVATLAVARSIHRE